MHDSAKYLIHADIEASGVVERSDVVGAIFGQTEGLLGDDLDIRDLQESGRLGRIEVEVDSEGGRSYGTLTIASGLDRVETAILAAALESIDRVGPCRADIEITDLEDARAAKRRDVVERATELLAEFDESVLSSDDIVEEVRRAVRVEDVTDFHGFPAGPRVADSDAVVVVEGRSDVLTLLEYGVKNAIAVEGTDVPDAVADLTRERTVTAFLDGDRGGDLILKELAQVGNIDYVALAPPDRSVEDLSREEVLTALREKVPFEAVDEEEVAAADDGSRGADGATDGDVPRSGSEGANADGESDERAETSRDPSEAATAEAGVAASGTGTSGARAGGSDGGTATGGAGAGESATRTGEHAPGPGRGEGDGRPAGGSADAADTGTGDGSDAEATDGSDASDAGRDEETGGTPDETGGRDREPQTLAGHVEAVVDGGTGLARALDADWDVLAEGPAEETFELLDTLEEVPAALVVDGELSQRVLDVAAQRGVEQVVCATEGEYVKQPADVRVRTAARL